MNREMLERLKKNPHYKLTPEQEAEYEKMTKSPMVTFGKVPKHNNSFDKHKVEVEKDGK